MGRAITFISMMYNAGSVLGPITGGWVGDHFGLRQVYFISAGIFILSTIVLLFIASQPRDHRDPQDPPPSLLTNWRYFKFPVHSFCSCLCNLFASTLDAEFFVKPTQSIAGSNWRIIFDWRLSAMPRSIFCSVNLKRAPVSCWVKSAYRYLLYCFGAARALAGSHSDIFFSADFARCAGWAWRRFVPLCMNRKWGLHMASPK